MVFIRKLVSGKKKTVFVLLVSIVVLFSLEQQHRHNYKQVECFQMIPNHDNNSNNDHRLLKNRRTIIASIPQFASIILLDPRNDRSGAATASAAFFDQQQDRRQKELCLVNLLRLQSWANSLSEKLDTITLDPSDEEKRKSLYLEARLGSKVVVAESKKISGGATVSVFMLKGLHIRECLEDLTYYVDKGSKRRQMNQYKEDLIESLASIVEFDGLETTQDPSPRSSLTLTMYNSQKSIFVQRMLAERIVPLIGDIFRLFDPDTRAQSESYLREYYPSEIMVTKSRMSSNGAADQLRLSLRLL